LLIGVSPRDRALFDKPAEPVWTPQAPRRGEDRRKPIRVNLAGRAKNRKSPLVGLFQFLARQVRTLQPAGLPFVPRLAKRADKRAAQRPLISPGAPINKKGPFMGPFLFATVPLRDRTSFDKLR